MQFQLQNQTVGNKYNLLKKIAVGGMAEIFLAEQTGPGGFKKRLVIKRILEHLIKEGDSKFLQMFQDEARLAAGLSHPNIVQIFELGQDNGTYYIAMEYIHGYNLRSVIKDCNKHGMWLSPEYIAKIGSQICEGLEYAHNFCDSDGSHLNIIHRDVSPQNLILSNQGVIKIVDFGIAKASSNEVKTQAGVIKGKLAYMSPEQVKGQKLDRRSDIFSLGIVLYELATHQRPFQGKSDLDILRAILEAKPTPIEQFRPDFPHEMSQIIYRALAKNREDRYSSSRDLQWDLERFIQNWGKPIGPFQLQQLVSKLEELNDEAANVAVTPAVPVTPPPQPAPRPAPPVAPPMPPAPAYNPMEAPSYDDLEEDTIYNPKGRSFTQPTAPPSHTPSHTPNHNSGYNKNTPLWDNPSDFEEEGEVTVMNASPIVSPSDFRKLAMMTQQSQDQMDDQDLMTIHESGNALNPSELEKMNSFLKPQQGGGPATMLDSSLPANMPIPDYLSPPPNQAPVASASSASARPSRSAQLMREHRADEDNEDMFGGKETVTVDSLESNSQHKPKKNSMALLLASLGVVLFAAIAVGVYFYMAS